MISLLEIYKKATVSNYTGKAWKHHIAEHFEEGLCPTHPNGAGKGGTIFLDYEKMLEYLIEDGRRWYVAELNLVNCPIRYDFTDKWMVTILKSKDSKEGFKPLNLYK
jgi:hypothetical protein